ncbi:MAG: class I SAM-dependent methyltransferase [Deltaproteobacteria bacterium]|nr:class I SAM-dependent methyltransferase [Deltaproteobacteria bacterium]
MHAETFSQFERQGWQRNAVAYDAVDLPATRQAFGPLLDGVGDLRGRHVLEVASGTGHLAAEALARGATVVGVDVARAMVALARQRAPGASFHEGDAEALPFKDEQFDSVICCFGFLHFAEPARALREAARVLKPGGIVGFTVWHAPQQGGEFFGLILGTFRMHANMDVGLPPAPPMFALADSEVRDPVLAQVGFREVRTRDVAIAWPLRGPETVIEVVLKGTVRMRMVYERQTPQIQERIRETLRAATTSYLRNGGPGIPCPAILVTARRP